MNHADEALHAAIREAELLRKRTQAKRTKQVRDAERSIVRATALGWFNSHRKQLTTIFYDGELDNVDRLYQQVMQASHKDSLRSTYVTVLKQIAGLLIQLRADNVIKLSAGSPIIATDEQPPDFSSLIQDVQMKAILERRWVECAACIAAKAPLAATVMMGGLLEGLLLAKVNSQSNKTSIVTAATAPRDKFGKTLQLKEWTLHNYIDVAHELKWITQTLKVIGGVLRDYRNYIHPQKEYSEKISLTIDDARLLWEISKNIGRQVLT